MHCADFTMESEKYMFGKLYYQNVFLYNNKIKLKFGLSLRILLYSEMDLSLKPKGATNQLHKHNSNRIYALRKINPGFYSGTMLYFHCYHQTTTFAQIRIAQFIPVECGSLVRDGLSGPRVNLNIIQQVRLPLII